MARTARRRRRAAAARGLAPDEIESYRLAVLPFNNDRVSRLPPQRRTLFEQHLREQLAEARHRLAAGETYSPPQAPPDDSAQTPAERDAESRLLGAGCATCRGKCCQLGGNHAFQSSMTLMGYLERFPSLDDDTIVSQYLAHLAEETLGKGCVFQGSLGCTLPRDMRAEICNTFFCGDIRMLKNRFSPGEPVRAYIVNQRGGRLTGGDFFDMGGGNST